LSSIPTLWHLGVPGGLDAPARARHAVAGELNGELSAERRSDLCLLLHELVANSVLHAGADASQTIHVDMTIRDEVVRVAVSDNGSESVPSVPADDEVRVGGRGLRVVEALSDAWGMRREGTQGTTMWFELRRNGLGPT
jgi:anti-sigma regulatory factor (Ser/Thr protein kinase)